MVLATSIGGKFATSVVKLFEEYSVIPLSSITTLTRQSLLPYETSPISSASLPLQLHTHVAHLLCSSGDWQRALAIVHALNKKEETELIEQATREDWPLPSSLRWSITSPSLVANTNNYENRECTQNILSTTSEEKLLCEQEETNKRECTEELSSQTRTNEENNIKIHNKKIEECTSSNESVISTTNNNGVESNEHSAIESNNRTELASQIISMPLEEIVNYAFQLDWPLANNFADWHALKKEQVAIFDELVNRHAWRELVQCAIHWERKRSRAQHTLESHSQREKEFTEQYNQEELTASGAIDFFRPVNAIQQMMFTLHSTPFHANTASILLNDVNGLKRKTSHTGSEMQTISSSPSSFFVAEYALTLDEQTALQNTVLEHYTSFFVECVTVNWIRSEYYFTNTPQSKSFAKRAAITLLKYISSSSSSSLECMFSANNGHASTLSTNLLHTAPFMSSFISTMESHSRMSNRWNKENKSNASLENAWSVLAFIMRQIHRELQVENFAYKRELLELIVHALQVSTQINKNTETLKLSTSSQYCNSDDVLLQLSRKTRDDMCGVMETVCSVLIRNEKEVQSLTLSVFAQLLEVLSVIQCNPPNALVQCLFLTIGDEPILTLHEQNTKLEESLGRNQCTKKMFTEDVEFVSYDKSCNNNTDDALHSSTSLMADKQVGSDANKEQITDVNIIGNKRDIRKSNDVLHAAIQFITSAPLSRWRIALHLLTCAKQQNMFAVTSAHLHALLSGLNGLSIAMTWSQALSCADYCNTHFQLIPDELTCRRMVSNLEHASWERAFEVFRWYNTKQEKYSYSILRDLHRIAMKHANWRVTLEIMEKLVRYCGTSFSFVHYLYTIHTLATAGEVETCWKYFIMMKQNTINGEDRSPFNVITISIPFVALLENEHYTEAQEFARLICNEVYITKTNTQFDVDSRDDNYKSNTKNTQWECNYYSYGTKANSVFTPYELTRSGLVLTLAVQLLCWLHLHDDKHILQLFNKLNYNSNEVNAREEKQEFMQNQWATKSETKCLGNSETTGESKNENNEKKNVVRKGSMYAITLAEVLEDAVLVQSMCGLAYLRAPVRLAYSLLEDRELENQNDKRVQESDIELAPSSECTSANEESRRKRKKMYISQEHRRKRSAILAELLGHFVQRHEKDMPEELTHTIASTMAHHNVGVHYLQACVM